MSRSGGASRAGGDGSASSRVLSHGSSLGSSAVPVGVPGRAQEAPGLYVHVPFCSSVCPYCDFAVRKGGPRDAAAFVPRLLREAAELVAACEPGRIETAAIEAGAALDATRAILTSGTPAFDTVYLGGGTPSLLPPDALAELLEGLRERLQIAPDARVFFEANPESVDPAALRAWHRLGIRTLSLGVQALDAASLERLGRRHGPEAARRALDAARAAGFEGTEHTVSIDLIYALPDRDADAWLATLEQALALEPDHLSCYELEIHAHTPFGKQAARGQLDERTEDDRARLFRATHQRLADAGFQGYEVSSFARAPHHRSRHNSKYWRHTPYLGLGPSAHSYAGRTRFWNERTHGQWRRTLEHGHRPLGGAEVLTDAQLALESAMLAFRTVDGLALDRFSERFGLDLRETDARQLDRWQAEGLMRLEGDRLLPTLDGLAVADRLAAELELGDSSERRSAPSR